MRLAVWPVLPARALARVLADLVTEVVEVEPHQARAALDDGRADLVLLPTLDVLRAYTGIDLLPGVALAGERSPRRHLVVGSALDAIETIGFDPRDTQEAILSQLVLREHYGTQATFALADPATPVGDVLARESAVLVDTTEAVPEGAFALDPGREWTDLTLRPYVWGLLAAREGEVGPEAAQRVRDAVQDASPSDDLFVDGVGAYQLTLDGYAVDGLAQTAEYLFQTGTLSEVPTLPFVEIPEDEAPASGEDAAPGEEA